MSATKKLLILAGLGALAYAVIIFGGGIHRELLWEKEHR